MADTIIIAPLKDCDAPTIHDAIGAVAPTLGPYKIQWLKDKVRVVVEGSVSVPTRAAILQVFADHDPTTPRADRDTKKAAFEAAREKRRNGQALTSAEIHSLLDVVLGI